MNTMETEPRQTWDNHARPIDWTHIRVPNNLGFLGSAICVILTLMLKPNPFSESGIRESKEKWQGDSELKVWTGCGIPRITIGIGRLGEHLDRDYDVRTPIGDQTLGYKNLRDAWISCCLVQKLNCTDKSSLYILTSRINWTNRRN